MSTRLINFTKHTAVAFYYIVVRGGQIELTDPNQAPGLVVNNPYA